MIYGHDKTFHRTNHVDVETDEQGNVVSVWFRCITLPFRQSKVDSRRADDMKRMYDKAPPKLLAVEVEDRNDS